MDGVGQTGKRDGKRQELHFSRTARQRRKVGADGFAPLHAIEIDGAPVDLALGEVVCRQLCVHGCAKRLWKPFAAEEEEALLEGRQPYAGARESLPEGSELRLQAG